MNSSRFGLQTSAEEQKQKQKQKQKKKMRIADFLKAEDDFINMSRDSISSSSSSPPRSILSRCLSSFKRSREQSTSSRRLASSRFEKSRDDDGLDGQSSPIISEKSKSVSKMVDSSGRCIKDLSVNLGIGVGLGFLISASKREFNKMTELQTQMEALIKEVKHEMQRKYVLSKPFVSNDNLGLSTMNSPEVRRTNYIKEVNNEMESKDVISMPSESNNILSFSTTNSPEVESTNYHPIIQSCALSHNLVEVPMESGLHLECDALRREGCTLGFDQLEAELEAELEHLQLTLDSEDPSENSHQQQMEVNGKMIVENTANDRNLRTSFGEVDKPQEANDEEHYGVSPNKLERKLHELLETRQKERIQELETALSCAKHELHKKEMEVIWWKDIAELISQHVLDGPHPSRE